MRWQLLPEMPLLVKAIWSSALKQKAPSRHSNSECKQTSHRSVASQVWCWPAVPTEIVASASLSLCNAASHRKPKKTCSQDLKAARARMLLSMSLRPMDSDSAIATKAHVLQVISCKGLLQSRPALETSSPRQAELYWEAGVLREPGPIPAHLVLRPFAGGSIPLHVQAPLEVLDLPPHLAAPAVDWQQACLGGGQPPNCHPKHRTLPCHSAPWSGTYESNAR
jgi:hypothetical protein